MKQEQQEDQLIEFQSINDEVDSSVGDSLFAVLFVVVAMIAVAIGFALFGG